MQYTEDQIEAIQNFMHEKRMSDEPTRTVLRKLEKMAKYAYRDSRESVSIGFLEKGTLWWCERVTELEVYYDSRGDVQMTQGMPPVLTVVFIADRDPPSFEIECRSPGCRGRMKDLGKKCWWCGK